MNRWSENGLQQQTLDVLTMESTLQTDLAGIYNEGEKFSFQVWFNG